MAERAKRGFRLPRLLVVAIVVVLLGGGAAVAWAATRTPGPTYRMATAAAATVTNTLNTTGTIQPVSQATVSFPVSGQVASVDVTQGQQVTAGQTLAQLNTNTLSAQVSSAQSSVATAQAKLAADQVSQTTVAAQPQTSSSTKAAGPSKNLVDGQNAVRAAQKKVDDDLNLVSAALKQEKTTCPKVIQSLGTQNKPVDTTTPATTTTTTAPPPPTSTGPSPTEVADCTELMQQVLDYQSKTSTDEHALASAEAALSTALSQAVSSAGQSSSAATKSSTTTNSSRTTGGSSAPASAAQIAADQAAVDSAQAQLAAALQNVAAATLVSPIDGTVAQVAITAGQSTSANSTSAHIVVIGAGASQVTTAVNDGQVGKVKPGQAAAITPDGATKPITGKVTSIGALSSTTSGGAASYPVTISLGDSSQPLFAGATASVSITLGTAQASVTVPTSAVHNVGGFSFVTKVVDGQPSQTRVTLGVVGSTLAQVSEGLSAGDQVVLADLSQELPTANSSTRGLTGGGGRTFGGAGGARPGGPTG